MNLIDLAFERERLEEAYLGVLEAVRGSNSRYNRDQQGFNRRLDKYRASRAEILDRIVARFKLEGTQRFQRLITLIPKTPGGKPKRPISLFSFEDRVVFRSILNVIWPHLERGIVPAVSYCTFRNKGLNEPRGIAKAAQVIASERRRNEPYIFESDIRSFFDSIPREAIIGQVRALLPDDTITEMLHAILYAEAIVDPRYVETVDLGANRGVPQGLSLSPLLACIYLSPFDQQMTEDGFRMLRYADDLVVLGSRMDCLNAEASARRILSQEYSLALHDEKTRQLSPAESLTFLGHEIASDGHLRPSPKRRAAVANHIYELICGYRSDKGIVRGLPGASQSAVVADLTNYVLGYFMSTRHCNWNDDDYAKVAHHINDALGGRGLSRNRLSKGLVSASRRWPKAFVDALA